MKTERMSFVVGVLVGVVGVLVAMSVVGAGGGVAMAGPGGSGRDDQCHGRFRMILGETRGFIYDSDTGRVWQKKITGEGQSSKKFFDSKVR